MRLLWFIKPTYRRIYATNTQPITQWNMCVSSRTCKPYAVLYSDFPIQTEANESFTFWFDQHAFRIAHDSTIRQIWWYFISIAKQLDYLEIQTEWVMLVCLCAEELKGERREKESEGHTI